MKPFRQLNRWIDQAWFNEGLLHASPQRPPFRLYLIPAATVLLLAALADALSSNVLRVAFIIALSALILLHFHIITRLSFISSLTEVSEQLAQGIEPPREQVEALTDQP